MIGAVFDGLTSARNWLFDRGFLAIQSVECPVVSVGNLTFGGTGKTPFVRALLEFLEKENFKAGVVSRGYGRASKGILEVTVGMVGASKKFGDEPTLLRTKHPTVAVWVGEKRAATARALLQAVPNTQVIIADDAFQHRALARDINVVLLDAAKPLSELSIFPQGRARESLKALARADFIVLTRMELAKKAHVESLKKLIEPFVKPSVFGELIECETQFQRLRDFSGREIAPKKYFAVSGIGSPEGFEKHLERVVGAAARGRQRKEDHHVYTQSEIAEIERQAREAGCEFILTTEKDEIKIRELKYNPAVWGVLPVTLKMSSSIQRLYARLRPLVIL